MTEPPIQIVISCAHADRPWLRKLLKHFGWYEQGQSVVLWNGARILAGSGPAAGA